MGFERRVSGYAAVGDTPVVGTLDAVRFRSCSALVLVAPGAIKAVRSVMAAEHAENWWKVSLNSVRSMVQVVIAIARKTAPHRTTVIIVLPGLVLTSRLGRGLDCCAAWESRVCVYMVTKVDLRVKTILNSV